jgi:hypothetical protein
MSGPNDPQDEDDREPAGTPDEDAPDLTPAEEQENEPPDPPDPDE